MCPLSSTNILSPGDPNIQDQNFTSDYYLRGRFKIMSLDYYYFGERVKMSHAKKHISRKHILFW